MSQNEKLGAVSVRSVLNDLNHSSANLIECCCILSLRKFHWMVLHNIQGMLIVFFSNPHYREDFRAAINY